MSSLFKYKKTDPGINNFIWSLHKLTEDENRLNKEIDFGLL
jgi:hypothetical protein